MGLIRIRALELLANKLECSVPKLRGCVCAGIAQHPERLKYPSAAILAAGSDYFPEQPRVIACPTPSTAVFCVGMVETTVQIYLWASNDNQRYALQDEIVSSLFYADIDHPGACLLTVDDTAGALATFDLDGFAWEEEKVYTNKWGSILTATMRFPALVKAKGVYSMENIQVMFTEDLSSDLSLIPSEDIETVSLS